MSNHFDCDKGWKKNYFNSLCFPQKFLLHLSFTYTLILLSFPNYGLVLLLQECEGKKWSILCISFGFSFASIIYLFIFRNRNIILQNALQQNAIISVSTVSLEQSQNVNNDKFQFCCSQNYPKNNIQINLKICLKNMWSETMQSENYLKNQNSVYRSSFLDFACWVAAFILDFRAKDIMEVLKFFKAFWAKVRREDLFCAA